VTGASHLAELEIAATDVAAAWNVLEPVVAQCAAAPGTSATKSDYHVGQPDGEAGVGGADLNDCLARVENPSSISVTYTAGSGSDPEPLSIELRIMRHRRFKELNVHVRVAGPGNMQTLGVFDRTEKALAGAIARFNGT
jgi:hypothetical protein